MQLLPPPVSPIALNPFPVLSQGLGYGFPSPLKDQVQQLIALFQSASQDSIFFKVTQDMRSRREHDTVSSPSNFV